MSVALNGMGARPASASFVVTSHGTVHAIGIEEAGSDGAGLACALSASVVHVIEVGRVNRQLRHRHGKTDTIDAEATARAVLAGVSYGELRSQDGTVEMIRHLKIVRDTTVKARSQAMVTLKTMLVHAPQTLREKFIGITGRMTLVHALAALRLGCPNSPVVSAKMALRALA